MALCSPCHHDAASSSQPLEPRHLMFAGVAVGSEAQEADLTTAQVRLGGRVAKFSVQKLRDNVSLIPGAGGDARGSAGERDESEEEWCLLREAIARKPTEPYDRKWPGGFISAIS